MNSTISFILGFVTGCVVLPLLGALAFKFFGPQFIAWRMKSFLGKGFDDLKQQVDSGEIEKD